MPSDALHLADSRIVGATVFSDCAHVTRRATLSLQRGLERVAIRNLPRELDPGSVRVSTSRGAVRSVENDVLRETPDPASDSVALERMVRALEAKTWRLTGEREALAAEVELIDRVVPTSPHFDGSSAAALRPESFLNGLDALITRRKSALKSLRAAELDLQATFEELREMRLRAQLTGTTANAEEQRSILVVHVDVEESGEAILDVVYESAWATWRPYYHVRLDPKDRTIECGRFADVWQETGEDWANIHLKLSTAEPETGLILPNVLPWTLGSSKSYEDKLGDLYRRRKQKAVAPPPSAPRGALAGRVVAALDAGGGGPPRPQAAPGAAPKDDFADYQEQFEDEGEFAEVTASGMDMLRSSAAKQLAMPAAMYNALSLGELHEGSVSAAVTTVPPPPPPPKKRPVRPEPFDERREGGELLRSPPPRESAGGIDHEIEVEVATTCPSGKERRRIGFGSVHYPAKLEYLLRPAVRDHAFGRVTVINGDNAPLIAGPASIFVGDSFFGETKIRTTPAGGKLILDLGAETAIKSARRTKTTVRTEGILTKEDVHVVEATIEVENFLEQPIELEIQDQVPVSQDPRVKVRLMRTVPKDAQLDELTGILTFKIRLTPGTKVEVVLVYEIEAPKDYEFRQTLKD